MKRSGGGGGNRTRIVAAAVLAAALGTAAGALAWQEPDDAPPVRSAEDVILAQLLAFNAQDVEALVANVAPDFVYFDVDDSGAQPQLQGREAFRRSMQEYFASIPGPRSEVEEIFPVGDFVAVRERAYWVQGGQEVSQAALAVYEIRDGLIRHVWYYPAQP